MLSGQFLAIQVLLTDYGDGRQGAAGFWFVVGCLLVSVVHGPAAFSDPDAAALALSHLGQAAPLLTDPVRRHVGATR